MTRPSVGSEHEILCAHLSRNLAVQLHNARTSMGYSQEEAAFIAGIAPPALGRIERARFSHYPWANPTLETMVRLHSSLNLNPHRWIRRLPGGDSTTVDR
ncbi:helix-turn-helix domain-containing protein [Microbacterium enclense]|uniref:helix-turn-helix domain-containing protein n=1 Tax=Microbacterium enclense TaxID=993073 RepID=UPI001428B541